MPGDEGQNAFDLTINRKFDYSIYRKVRYDIQHDISIVRYFHVSENSRRHSTRYIKSSIFRYLGKFETISNTSLDTQFLGRYSLLEPQPRFGDRRLNFQVVCPQNGAAALKGSTQPNTWQPGRSYSSLRCGPHTVFVVRYPSQHTSPGWTAVSKSCQL